MGIVEIYKNWTEEERKQAIISMPVYRQAELASEVRAAGYSASEVLSAGYSTSALRAAGYSASEVLSAGYSAPEVRAAGYSASALRSAGYSASALRDTELSSERDIKNKCKKMGREESQFVCDTLYRGLMDGRQYGSIESCGCFLGSAAKKARLSVDDFCKKLGIKKNADSPAEKWFMGVSVGDTPENNYAAKKGVEWIEEAIKEMDEVKK